VTLLEEALTYHQHGLTVVPTANDGSKRPAIAWQDYTHAGPTEQQIRDWFTPDGGPDGLGLICGATSGNLEMLEVEGRAGELVAQLKTLMDDNGFGDLWQRLCSGYLEQSPSGGLHWLYRVDGPARPNTKLARRPATPDELHHWKATETAKADQLEPERRAQRLDRINATTPEQIPMVLIETRGEGGFTVAAPSAGRTHPTGKPWVRLAGHPSTIPVITVDERDALHAIANMLDSMPAAEPIPAPVASTSSAENGTRPGDDYNTKATWADILEPAGWTRTKRLGGGYGWTRPGKSARDGISATTGTSADGVDRLYVFSSSTEFETEKPYTKFAAYTLLEHHGDYAAAAKALARDGYGTRPEHRRPDDILELLADPPTGTDPAQNATQPPASGSGSAATVTSEPDTYTLSDDGNALRLIDTYADAVRYCPQRGQWLTWRDARWTWDEAGHVQELARTIARHLPDDGKDEHAHRRASLSARGVNAMIALARTDPRATVHLTQLDAEPYELNTPGGVVDLRTGVLNPPNPDKLHTRTTNVTPTLGPAPRWEKFLADTFAGDQQLTTYVQRLLGLSLVGTVLEQTLPFAFGSGANGKTTLLGVTQRLIGIGDGGYSISAPADLLLATHNQGHPTEIARLAGARVVVTSELEDGQRFAEAKVKQLTGRDVISGRFMRQDWFSFTPTHTLWLLANHQPEVRAGGPAFWRRIALLPFLHTVPADQRDPHLEDRLVEDEGPAILAWLIAGAADYLARGLERPASVDVATDAYAKDQDTIARFVEECCDLAPAGTQTYAIASTALRAAYETWCRSEGETPVPAKTLTLQLRSRFDVQNTRTRAARMLSGIRLKPELDDSDEPADDGRQTEWWGR